MGRHDNINPLDSAQANRRVRILEYLQEVFNYLWLIRAWPFSMRTASVSVVDRVALNLPDRLPRRYGQGWGLDSGYRRATWTT